MVAMVEWIFRIESLKQMFVQPIRGVRIMQQSEKATQGQRNEQIVFRQSLAQQVQIIWWCGVATIAFCKEKNNACFDNMLNIWYCEQMDSDIFPYS